MEDELPEATVRPAVVEDAKAVARVHLASSHQAYRRSCRRAARRRSTSPNAPAVARAIAGRHGSVLVTDLDGEIVGFAHVGHQPPRGAGFGTQEIYAIYLEPLGVGPRLARELMRSLLGKPPRTTHRSPCRPSPTTSVPGTSHRGTASPRRRRADQDRRGPLVLRGEVPPELTALADLVRRRPLPARHPIGEVVPAQRAARRLARDGDCRAAPRSPGPRRGTARKGRARRERRGQPMVLAAGEHPRLGVDAQRPRGRRAPPGHPRRPAGASRSTPRRWPPRSVAHHAAGRQTRRASPSHREGRVDTCRERRAGAPVSVGEVVEPVQARLQHRVPAADRLARRRGPARRRAGPRRGAPVPDPPGPRAP